MNQWPVKDCLLANWWPESEQQAGAIENDGAGRKLASAKAIQANCNEFEFSGLLNIPGKIDNWFRAIDDMTKAFFNEHEKLPNETQAWVEFWTSPPDGYKITTGKDKGEDCLLMPGFGLLSKSAFDKRWKNYTTNKSQ